MNNIFKILIIVLFTLTNGDLFGQSWTTLPNCPKKLDHTVGFQIGSNFFIGTGYDSIYGPLRTNKFFKFDVNSNSWSAISSLADSVRCYSISFEINGKGYVGFGASPYACFLDFYEYEPALDKWTKKADCPIPFCPYSSSAFSLNGRGYVMTGALGSGSITSVYQYDPLTDMWTQKNNFPGSGRSDAMAVSIGSKGYFGMGRTWQSIIKDDIWEYDDLTDNWNLITNYPNGPNFWITSLVHNNELYLAGGGQPTNTLVMKYNPTSNVWTNITGIPAIRHAGIGFSYDCKIFICAGYGQLGIISDLISLKVDSICLNIEGISEKSVSRNLQIYPNPAKGKFIIRNGRDNTVKVFNVIGKEVIISSQKMNEEDIEVTLNDDGLFIIYLLNKQGKTLGVSKLINE